MTRTRTTGRAVRLHGPRDIRIEPIEQPTVRDDQLLLRITAVGICGSDLHWYAEGAIGETTLDGPLVLGHEFVAVVDRGERAGERVAVDPADPCGQCDLCGTGRGRLCRSIRFAGLAPHDGALQTWLAWPGSHCFAVPDSIPDAEATLLEVVGIALHATTLGEFQPGMSAGVYGAGPIGQVIIRALRAMGAARIVASDRIAHRVEAAGASGADEAIMVEDGSADRAADIPVDIAFECAGSDAAIDTAVRAVRPGGTVLLLGIPSTVSSTFPASPARRKEIRLQSVRRMEGADLPRAIDLVASGRLSLAGLVTARYPFEQAGAAFETAIERQGLKTVILL